MVKVKVIELLRILARERAYREIGKKIISVADNNQDVEQIRSSYIRALETRTRTYEESLIFNYEKDFGEMFQLIFEGNFTAKVNKEGVSAPYLVADYNDTDGNFFLLFHHYHSKEEAEKGIEDLIRNTWVLSLQDLYVIEDGKKIIDFILAVDKDNLSAKVRWLE